MLWFKSKTNELDKELLALKNFYGNNYKDEAHKSFRECKRIFEELKNSGKLSKKDITKYTEILNSYTVKLTNYSHYDRIGW